MKYGLSDAQFDELIQILATYREIEAAVLFGSRALGTYKEASDVDIALKGEKVTAALAAKLKYHLEEETYQPFFYDFVAYPTITNEALKEHINSKGISVFRRGWREYRISELIAKGDLFIGDGYRAKNSELAGFGIPFARAGNINNGFHFENADYFPETDIEKLGNKISAPGDVVFTSKGTVGRFAFVRDDTPKFVYSPQLCFWRVLNSNKFSNSFLYYWMQSKQFWCQASSVKDQTDMAEYVNLSDQRNMTLAAPSLPEQKAIASFLSSLDDKIELLHRQNKTLEAMAETLFRQWFVEGIKTDETAFLCDYSQNVRDIATVDELSKHYNYVGLEHIPKKEIAITRWGAPNGLESNKSIFRKEDILFGKLRSYFHKVVFAPVEGVCSTDILVIRPKKKEWFAFCLLWFFNKNVVDHSDLGSEGTRMPRTNWEILSDFEIPKPEIKQIEEFDMIIRPFIEKITFNIHRIHTLEKLRATLLPKLMSGEVRVKYIES
jgi:type I restriction enzyme S subunit